MSEPFAKKLELVLKVLSMSRARLAADLGVDKSVVGRWVTGAVQPSAHNLSLLSALIAQRIPGFTALDWDRSLSAFGEVLGADLDVDAPDRPPALPYGLPLPLLDRFIATSALRGPAYEGFYRSTRPYVLAPGHFVHDHSMLRMEPNGLLSTKIGTAGTLVEGFILFQGNQMYTIAVDVTSGAMLFGMFNGVGTARAEVVDGIALTPALDAGRTPTAHPIMFERIGDLSGDREADDAHFAALAARNPVAPEGSISDALRHHLTGDFGPKAAAAGGEWLLQMPLSRSLARGPAYRRGDDNGE